MKKSKIPLLLSLFLVFIFQSPDAYAEDKVIGNASVGIFNRYIFRGYELSSHSVVIQPA
jgi:hypothetical protein